MERKVYPTAKGNAVSLPKELLEVLQVSDGEKVVIEVDVTQRRLVISSMAAESGDKIPSGENGAISELGRRLHALRTQIVASGAELLDWEGLETEVSDRRGEC